MSEPVYGMTEFVARFVASIPPFKRGRDFGNCVAIGWAVAGELVGGTVYNNYDADAGIIELSTASLSPRWLSRKSLQVMFGYPFDQLGCQMVVLRVSERNDRMCKIARRFGFNEYRIPRLRGADEAESIFTLTVEQWKEKGLSREQQADPADPA